MTAGHHHLCGRWDLRGRRGAARTGLGKEVGGELGSDGLAAVRLAIGARVAIVGDDGRDRSSARPLACIDGDQQLHQVVIHRRAARLHQEHVAAANRFLRRCAQVSANVRTSMSLLNLK